MIALADAVRDEAKRMTQEKVVIDLRHTDVFSAETLSAALDQIGTVYDGVAVVALDHPRVRESINALTDRGVAVVTLVSDVPNSRRQHYVGIDNASAGRTAATLMGRYLCGREGKVGLIAGSLSLRDHVERQFGFEQVMLHEYPNLSLLPVREGRDDGEIVQRVAAQLLAENSDLIGIYNVGAGARGIAAALEAAGRQHQVIFITHELTDDTRLALIGGTIDIIINQDAGHEVRSAIRVLMSKADKIPLVDSMERIRIDIYLRDNIP
jgi:LacI family transcriptional regulator